MRALLLITLAGCTAARPVMRAPVSHPTTQAEVERLKGHPDTLRERRELAAKRADGGAR